MNRMQKIMWIFNMKKETSKNVLIYGLLLAKALDLRGVMYSLSYANTSFSVENIKIITLHKVFPFCVLSLLILQLIIGM